jgi:hypothetical protein
MVLIFGLLGCLAVRSPIVVESAVPVTTVVTLVNPEEGVVRTDNTAQSRTAIDAGLKAHGLSIQPVNLSSEFHQLGTTQRRTHWLVEHTEHGLSVLIEANARPRSQLGGRFQWVVNASITVAGKSAEPLVQHLRLPTTLPHIHQDETDALLSVAPQLAAHTARQIERHQGGGE